MNVKTHLWTAAGVMVCLAGIAEATPPWQRMIPFKRVEANPEKAYPITDQNGPWMIMATTFRGENAEAQARELVLELRTQHKLNAYTHKKVYDFTGMLKGRGVNPDGSPRMMRYAQGGNVEEVAVLVGDYQTVDDSGAQKTLQKLKYAQPESLVGAGKGDSQSFSQLRRWQQSLMRDGDDNKQKGPMRHAFITTNPLLPKEYFAPKGVDKLVLSMNEGVEHSLLDCQGKYTVRIATFTGRVVLDQREIEKLEREGDSADHSKSSLAKAAIRAHKLTTALRKDGVEAYEFHDRETSIVTVGSFQSVGSPRPDGKTEINPQIHEIMKKYGGQQSQRAVELAGGAPAAGVQAQRIAGVSLDIQPMPVEVPRRAFSSDYRQTTYQE